MFIYKELTIEKLWKVAVESAISCAQVLVLISAATVLAWILTVSQVSTILTSVLLSNVTSPLVFLLILNLILLVMGMFMDGSAAILIIAPLVFNMGVGLGVNGVHMCIVMIANLAVGMYTPPFGMNLFITNSITKMDMMDMLRGVWPFLGVNVISLLVITYCPSVIMFLPNMVG